MRLAPRGDACVNFDFTRVAMVGFGKLLIGFAVKIAVVTPYYKETLDQIQRCHRSVKDQTVPCDHFLVSDGFPQDVIDGWDAHHIRLPNHADYGDTPRMVGAASAASLGYDAILLLDADNWFEPVHVETLVALARESEADVITCTRMLRRCVDLTPMGACTESDGNTFNDTNCYMVMARAFPIFRAWGFKDPSLGIVGDRIFWNALKTLPLKLAHSDRATVNYVTTFGFHYAIRGEEPPENAKDIVRMPDGKFKMMSWAESREYLKKLMDEQAETSTSILAGEYIAK